MPMSFSEPPIPPFSVVIVTPSGEIAGYVDMPAAWGWREDCARFIADHLPPVGYKLDVMNIDTGALVSYAIPASNANQVRLTLQDTSPIV